MPQRLLTYLQECLRLLYWSYFKPYTFRRWLREIHPTLDIYDNPFKERAAFADNPHLKRYAEQVKWLVMLVPIFISVAISLLYSLLSSESFNWIISIVFLAGWVIGILISSPDKSQHKNLFIWVLWILVCLALLLPEKIGIFGEIHFFENQGNKMISLLILLVGGILFSVTFALSFGIAFSIAVSVSIEIIFYLSFGIALGVVIGLTNSVVNGVTKGVAMGIIFGVVIAVLKSVAIGVAFSAVFIAGVLRLWFWLPELIWMIRLNFLPIRPSKALRYLPIYFDELIILPLPFMDRLIIRAYHDNPAIARQTITHLTTHTNQQKVATRAMVGIAIERLNQAKTAIDISLMANELDWLPSPPPAAVGKLLPKLLDISRDVQAALAATTPYLRRELLNKPLIDLQDLTQQLALSGNAYQATQFGSIIKKWQVCLQTAQATLAQQMEQSQ
jgi:uncharacterized protein